MWTHTHTYTHTQEHMQCFATTLQIPAVITHIDHCLITTLFKRPMTMFLVAACVWHEPAVVCGLWQTNQSPCPGGLVAEKIKPLEQACGNSFTVYYGHAAWQLTPSALFCCSSGHSRGVLNVKWNSLEVVWSSLLLWFLSWLSLFVAVFCHWVLCASLILMVVGILLGSVLCVCY